ncbi:hypothetical protein NMK44_37990 [Streptomyces sp. NEAU-Y11]|nr:hypothetical protein [Streptomyces sp. NEAU-Y11]
MGELRPLGDNLPDECRAFAMELRGLFAGLEVSVRRYAVRRHRDPSTVSRFLSGTRIPPWEFVFDLFTDLAARRGAAVTPAAIELMRDLHRAAVRTSRSPAHAMEILQVQLADADREARCSLAHQDALGEVLLDRKHRIADLEVRLNQAEAAWAMERARADALERGSPDREELIKERDKLEREVRGSPRSWPRCADADGWRRTAVWCWSGSSPWWRPRGPPRSRSRTRSRAPRWGRWHAPAAVLVPRSWWSTTSPTTCWPWRPCWPPSTRSW